MARSLRDLGVNAGDVILVHSSLKSFGYVVGVEATVVDALLDAVAPAGTVMVPTITVAVERSPVNPPVFDVCNPPCRTEQSLKCFVVVRRPCFEFVRNEVVMQFTTSGKGGYNACGTWEGFEITRK